MISTTDNDKRKSREQTFFFLHILIDSLIIYMTQVLNFNGRVGAGFVFFS
jgi:hypothetical protein